MQAITRRQFFARLRSLGFSKADFQLTRVGITYTREADRVSVTVPKYHSKTFHILGDVPFRGFYFQGRNSIPMGHQIPEGWDALSTCVGLLNGSITISGAE